MLWSKEKKPPQGIISLIGSAFAFSLMTVCIKQLKGRIPVAEIVFLRSVFSLLITRFLLTKAQISPWGNNKRLLFFRGLIGTGALFCVFQAINSLPLAAATIIQYTYPTFTALLAWWMLDEEIKKRVLYAICLGWIGIQVVVQPLWQNNSNVQISFNAVLIALSGAILTALAYVTVRKLSKQEHDLVIVFYFPLVSIPITLPFLLKQGVYPAGSEWLWLLGIGLFTQIGQVLITRGLSLLPAGYAGSINYTQVLFASMWGVLFFAEPLTLYIIIGAGCVFGATLISISHLPNF
ncbi:Integral membrane protein [Prochlorococcus sp. MIT 0602]|nr:Integral membrane protein [Prochlorococcus sp. MIT 0602]